MSAMTIDGMIRFTEGTHINEIAEVIEKDKWHFDINRISLPNKLECNLLPKLDTVLIAVSNDKKESIYVIPITHNTNKTLAVLICRMEDDKSEITLEPITSPKTLAILIKAIN